MGSGLTKRRGKIKSDKTVTRIQEGNIVENVGSYEPHLKLIRHAIDRSDGVYEGIERTLPLSHESVPNSLSKQINRPSVIKPESKFPRQFFHLFPLRSSLIAKVNSRKNSEPDPINLPSLYTNRLPLPAVISSSVQKDKHSTETLYSLGSYTSKLPKTDAEKVNQDKLPPINVNGQIQKCVQNKQILNKKVVNVNKKEDDDDEDDNLHDDTDACRDARTPSPEFDELEDFTLVDPYKTNNVQKIFEKTLSPTEGVLCAGDIGASVSRTDQPAPEREGEQRTEIDNVVFITPSHSICKSLKDEKQGSIVEESGCGDAFLDTEQSSLHEIIFDGNTLVQKQCLTPCRSVQSIQSSPSSTDKKECLKSFVVGIIGDVIKNKIVTEEEQTTVETLNVENQKQEFSNIETLANSEQSYPRLVNVAPRFLNTEEEIEHLKNHANSKNSEQKDIENNLLINKTDNDEQANITLACGEAGNDLKSENSLKEDTLILTKCELEKLSSVKNIEKEIINNEAITQSMHNSISNINEVPTTENITCDQSEKPFLLQDNFHQATENLNVVQNNTMTDEKTDVRDEINQRISLVDKENDTDTTEVKFSNSHSDEANNPQFSTPLSKESNPVSEKSLMSDRVRSAPSGRVKRLLSCVNASSDSDLREDSKDGVKVSRSSSAGKLKKMTSLPPIHPNSRKLNNFKEGGDNSFTGKDNKLYDIELQGLEMQVYSVAAETSLNTSIDNCGVTLAGEISNESKSSKLSGDELQSLNCKAIDQVASLSCPSECGDCIVARHSPSSISIASNDRSNVQEENCNKQSRPGSSTSRRSGSRSRPGSAARIAPDSQQRSEHDINSTPTSKDPNLFKTLEKSNCLQTSLEETVNDTDTQDVGNKIVSYEDESAVNNIYIKETNDLTVVEKHLQRETIDGVQSTHDDSNSTDDICAQNSCSAAEREVDVKSCKSENETTNSVVSSPSNSTKDINHQNQSESAGKLLHATKSKSESVAEKVQEKQTAQFSESAHAQKMIKRGNSLPTYKLPKNLCAEFSTTMLLDSYTKPDPDGEVVLGEVSDNDTPEKSCSRHSLENSEKATEKNETIPQNEGLKEEKQVTNENNCRRTFSSSKQDQQNIELEDQSRRSENLFEKHERSIVNYCTDNEHERNATDCSSNQEEENSMDNCCPDRANSNQNADMRRNSSSLSSISPESLDQGTIENIKLQALEEGLNTTKREGGVSFFIPCAEEGLQAPVKNSRLEQRMNKFKKKTLNHEERMFLAGINRQVQLSKKCEFAHRDLQNVQTSSSCSLEKDEVDIKEEKRHKETLSKQDMYIHDSADDNDDKFLS